VDPGSGALPVHRPAVVQPVAQLRTVVVPKPLPKAREVLHGLASWYANGTTAMRLPYGTEVRICGAGGCVSTVVRDWGPARYLSDRVVDMTPRDFVRVTGRPLGAGLAKVTVYVY
jgi:hypothetical protein